MNKLNYKKIIYPGTLILIILVIVVVSFFTIRFLTTNINAAFDINESALEASTIKIDIEGYKLAAKKLNIQYPAESTSPTLPSPAEEEQ